MMYDYLQLIALVKRGLQLLVVMNYRLNELQAHNIVRRNKL